MNWPTKTIYLDWNNKFIFDFLDGAWCYKCEPNLWNKQSKCLSFPIWPQIHFIFTKFKKKEFGLPILVRLLHHMHSPAQSHYCLTRALWTAGFPPWPESHLIRQPGHPGFPQGVHVDAELSADAGSTCHTMQQDSRPQAILKFQPPNRLDYRARYRLQLINNSQNYVISMHK